VLEGAIVHAVFVLLAAPIYAALSGGGPENREE
jgi:hypothetical protein